MKQKKMDTWKLWGLSDTSMTMIVVMLLRVFA